MREPGGPGRAPLRDAERGLAFGARTRQCRGLSRCVLRAPRVPSDARGAQAEDIMWLVRWPSDAIRG